MENLGCDGVKKVAFDCTGRKENVQRVSNESLYKKYHHKERELSLGR